MKFVITPARQLAATDREIDTLVYELYGLTEEEIRIVEGDLSPVRDGSVSAQDGESWDWEAKRGQSPVRDGRFYHRTHLSSLRDSGT